MNIKIKKFMLIFLCTLLLSACSINEKNNLNEIKNFVTSYDVEFKSKRGFGNDRFDIYSFKIENDDLLKDFNLKDDDVEEIYQHNFKSMFDEEIENNKELENLKNRIEELIKTKGYVYKYYDIKGTHKLYLYNKDLNIGYCLIITI